MSRSKNNKLSGKKTSKPSSYINGITLEDVAKLAGVSPITVSRVLNKPDLVAQKTIEKVHQAITRTGYVPNLLAGGLASRRSRLIAAIIPSIVNPIYAETIRFFIDRLEEDGYQVLLGESGYTLENEERLIQAILGRRPDAVLLTGTIHSAESRRQLLSVKVPIVETWDITTTPLDAVVGFSHEKVARAVANYLFKKGYRKIGIISADDTRAQLRKQEFIKTLAGLGINNVTSVDVSAPPDLKKGRDALEQMLDNNFSSGAVFCSSDTLANGVLTEALSRGLSLPRDIAIMGFGDQNFSEHTFPPLSTVKIDRSAIGRIAAEALLARLDGKENLDNIFDVGYQIIERETT